MNPITALAMAEELVKSASLPRILRRVIAGGGARAVARGGLTRTLGGAAIGGLVGGVTSGAEGDPEEVAARRKSRIVKGALIGAAGGYASPLLTSGGRARAFDATKRFFGRERHGLLGGQAPSSFAPGDVQQGLTSIPGVVKGLVTKPGTVLRSGWEQGGRLGKAMTLGSAALGVSNVMDPNAPGGKGERVGNLIGDTAGMLAGSRLPFMSNLLFATATGTVGKHLGRAVDKITGSGRQPIVAEPQAVP